MKSSCLLDLCCNEEMSYCPLSNTNNAELSPEKKSHKTREIQVTSEISRLAYFLAMAPLAFSLERMAL